MLFASGAEGPVYVAVMGLRRDVCVGSGCLGQTGWPVCCSSHGTPSDYWHERTASSTLLLGVSAHIQDRCSLGEHLPSLEVLRSGEGLGWDLACPPGLLEVVTSV